MVNINKWIADYSSKGYSELHSEARICQDIVLLAISKSEFRRNVTVKGGIIMRSISDDSRRATLDIDLDFIKFSLEDESIRKFISKLNVIEGVKIEIVGKIETLRQQDYQGKRVYISVNDTYGKSIRSKIDFGVHTRFKINQSEYSFDVCLDEDGASMLINTNEQIFTEKLRSLLKLGPFNTRYKDIFDMSYLLSKLDRKKLKVCLNEYVFDDDDMRESNIPDISSRLKNVFDNKRYRQNLNTTDKNWLEKDIDNTLNGILDYFNQFTL